MASSLGEAAGEADGGALAGHDGQALGVGGLEDLVAEDAGADVDGGAGVVGVGPVGKVDGFEGLRPDGEGACAGGAAEEAGEVRRE